MTKFDVYNTEGKKAKNIETDIFSGDIREDIVQKVAEIERLEDMQAYAPYLWAGMQTSASGNVKHNRHVWKTDRGRGMSRYPKKRMSDKGSHFVWVAAVVPGTRGGRRAHPPKIIKKDLKINKKEKILALRSALAMISSSEMVKKKYSSLINEKISLNFPIILEEKFLELKSKDFYKSLRKILGETIFNLALKKVKIRPGIGKMRGRRYKSNAGILLITGTEENKKISGIDTIKVKELEIKDIASNGARICAMTEKAVKELEINLHKKK